MATGNINVMASGLADLDKLLQSLEIENKQQQHEIKKEQQQAAVFEAATEKKNFKTLQEDTARLNEENKAGHQQFRHNRETYQSLKSHHLALVLNQETAQKDLQELHDKWQVQRPQHERALQHYESIWEQYKAKYEERGPAVKLRKWQQQLAETKERLEDSKGKVKILESAIHETQEKRRNSLKPFKSRNQWIIKIATAWAETRQNRNDNEKMQQAIRETERKIQEKKERQLKLQKAQLEEQERKRKIKEAEDKKQLEDQERQKQQQLLQQKQLQRLKEQQQQNQQKLLQQQQQHSQQQPEHLLSPPQRIPQSPLQQPATARTTQSQYFQSPLIGHAPSRSTAAASPQQQSTRHPPYLQMPIMASPRQTPVSTSNFSCSTPSYAPQLFTLKMPSESPLKKQRQPQPKLPSAIACIPTHPDGRAPPRQAVPTRKGVDVPREPESRQAKQVSSHTSQIRGDEPAKGHGESELLVDQQGDKEMMEERQEISVGSGDTVENPPQTPIDEDPHAEDPNEATSGAFQPPMSPFDLEAHFQNLNEMAKSPGFTFSCRPMFSGEDENDDVSEISRPSAARSSADSFSSQFLQPFFNQPDESPMEVGPSRPQEGGILSLFGGGQGEVNKTKDDQEESPATPFSFNFSSSSPNVKSPSAKSFCLF
ncbi:putative mediator of RNA polymerase II transcription subunit 26 [Asterias rubens]|uniref:putative mediator of RNA polymerase II transcription subunit 26 n=1 Tax=Asterias rubens TaxID=7604 RepID=UPI0014558B35|nr:putative mediator of RNA polymerase II transcription subunit 26 [Asterias rubens]